MINQIKFGYKLKKNLILTGMMAVGKSLIGKDLSKKLNMEFKDIDKIIEKKLSKSISEIFKKDGENFFRKIEEKETLNYINKNKLVIALGGGAFINKKIRNSCEKKCVSFWLDLDAKIIFQRIKLNMKRPLFNNKTTEIEVKKLSDTRKKIYSLSDFRINCNSKNRSEIVEEIIKIYESI